MKKIGYFLFKLALKCWRLSYDEFEHRTAQHHMQKTLYEPKQCDCASWEEFPDMTWERIREAVLRDLNVIRLQKK